jgi:hypothetical protein
MLTLIFLAFIAMFAIGGIFISIEAKRRSDGSLQRQLNPRDDKPRMGRATPGND